MPEQVYDRGDSLRQTTRLLEWAKAHSGRWNLICTPDSEMMTAGTMHKIAEELIAEGFYELLFVMLTVHRRRGNVQALAQQLLFDLLPDEWQHDPVKLTEKILYYLQ